MRKKTHDFYEQENNKPKNPDKDGSNEIPLSDILDAPRMKLSKYKDEIKQNAEGYIS